MTKRWNDIKAVKTAREQSLAGSVTPPPTVTPLPSLPPTEPNIVIGAGEPTFPVVGGLAFTRTDTLKPNVISPEQWVARPRPPGFKKDYKILNPVLDSALISAQGLSYSSISKSWIDSSVVLSESLIGSTAGATAGATGGLGGGGGGKK